VDGNVRLWFSHVQRGGRPVAILLGEMGLRLPATVDQHFVRRIARLVVHLGAAFDPVAEVDVRQGELARLFDLPQYAVVAVAGARLGS